MASLRFRLRQTYWRWAAPGKIRGYMERNSVRKLQIGTGANLLPGWLNTTLYPFTPGSVFLDASQAFPIPDNSFDYVFSEHVIEHLEFEQAEWMLKESCAYSASRRPHPHRYTGLAANHRALHAAGAMKNSRPISAGSWIPFVRRLANIIRRRPSTNPFTAGGTSSFMTKIRSSNPWLAPVLLISSELSRDESEYEHLRAIEQHGEYVGSDAAMRYETMVLEAIKAGQG